MISEDDFRHIKNEVEEAVNDAFQYARCNEVDENDYILFLANAENISRYEDAGVNPHIIDYRVNKIKDQERINFLLHYLNANYRFPENESQDSPISISLELMIYSHIWESKPFLRQLKKLANLCESVEYDWSVSVPEMGKHDFIRNDIRNVFSNSNLDIHNVMRNGFHTSLRNAFAHSDYYFQFDNPIIYLTNYGGAAWEIQNISFDDWTRRFCYSFLLSFTFQNKFETEKQNLLDIEYDVQLRNTAGLKVQGGIRYDAGRNAFRGRIL